MSFLDKMASSFADELAKIEKQGGALLSAGKVLLPGVAATLAAQRILENQRIAEQLRKQQAI